MSNSPRGILAYGYDLGGMDSGLKFSTSNNTNIDFIDVEKAERIILAQIVNFTETWETRTDDQFWSRFEEAKKKLGIRFVCYCSYDYPSYIIATQVFEAIDWGSTPVKPHLDHSAYERLQRACGILGIVPNEPEPSWILASFYG